jgi:hypothetical protein
MPNSDFLEIVWGETSQLKAKDGTPQTLARLHAILAKLAISAKENGIDAGFRRSRPPYAGTPEAAVFDALAKTVAEVEANTYVGNALPDRAALSQIRLDGTPMTSGSLPEPARWLTATPVQTSAEFVASDGTVYGLYEKIDLQAAKTSFPFASQVTGTGLPQQESPNPRIRLAWVLGFAAMVVLVLGAIVSAWTGHNVGEARNALVQRGQSEAYFLEKVYLTCAGANSAAPICDKANLKDAVKVPVTKENPEGMIPGTMVNAAKVFEQSVKCLKNKGLLDAEQGKPQLADPNCEPLWRAALATQDRGWMTALSSFLSDRNIKAGTASLVFPFAMVLAGIAGLVIALGLGTRRRPTGVWIDTRNRVSLARAQVTLWTVVALGGYAVLAMFNAGFSSMVAPGALADHSIFPAIPGAIAAALGISIASPMISAVILSSKEQTVNEVRLREETGDARTRGAPFMGAASDGLDKRVSPDQASIADIFMGEEVADQNTVDVARLQNVVITVLLILGFLTSLFAMMTIRPANVIAPDGVIFASLPELGASFASLLLLSHATYLISKAHDSGTVKDQNATTKK